MKRGTPEHPKTHDLASRLGLEKWGAVGVVEALFHFAAAYARRGDVGRHSDLAIARAIGWTRDAGELVEALVAAGWLDRCSCHRLRVHDWPDHADQTVARTHEVKQRGFLECYGERGAAPAPYRLPPTGDGEGPAAASGPETSTPLASDEHATSQPLPSPLPLPTPEPSPEPTDNAPPGPPAGAGGIGAGGKPGLTRQAAEAVERLIDVGAKRFGYNFPRPARRQLRERLLAGESEASILAGWERTAAELAVEPEDPPGWTGYEPEPGHDVDQAVRLAERGS